MSLDSLEHLERLEHALDLLARTCHDDFAEEISHLDHCVQTYLYLKRAYPEDTELAVAGFWHDIGHSMYLDGVDIMQDRKGTLLGVQDHDRLAAELFAGVLPDRVCQLISLHTMAKRYAAGTGSKFSSASTETLALEGGTLTEAERKDFEAHSLFRDALQLREGDDSGKNPACNFDGNRDGILLAALRDTVALMRHGKRDAPLC